MRIDVELRVEQRMVVGDPRCEAAVTLGLAEAAGVGELQADEQVVAVAARRFAVAGVELVEQLAKAGRD